MIDSHAHLTFEELENNLDTVIADSVAAGVNGWITIGTDREHNRKVANILDKHKNLYGAVGIHPHYAAEVCDNDIQKIADYAENKKIVAVGETGLDFFYKDNPTPQQQIKLFEQMLQIAIVQDKPVIIHARNAFAQTMEVLDNFKGRLKNVVFHCFSEDIEAAKIVLDNGFYISFTGVVTFKNAEQSREVAKFVPLHRLMLETDCPYMSPAPMRKQKINTPALMVHTAAKIAELKGISLEQIDAQTVENTTKFFGIELL